MRGLGMRSPMERFWAQVNKEGDCWLWTGSPAGAGYGHFHVSGGAKDRIRAYAHRWIYEQMVGPIPRGLEIDHLCRRPLCVNPEHLEPVTHAESRRRARGVKYRPKQLGTTCRNGHPRTPENTGVNPSGARFCRPCARANAARHRKSQQEKTAT